jgi:acetyl/propionyl-CoA carboxylase alpha subunit
VAGATRIVNESQPEPTTIRRLLIADRGALGRRVIRTCRSLGIETVAIHDDTDAELPHVAEADLAVRLLDEGPDVARLVEAARRSGADALHPVGDTLAMSAELATAVIAEGLKWVGLAPATIAAVGSRIDARERVRAANVAALAAIDVTGMDRVELLSSAERIGLPLVVKPIAGRDGDLARRVDAMGDVEPTVRTTSRDATGELDDGRLFLERHVEAGRRLSVPVIADGDGHAVALLEWETTSRRGDVPELTESPSPSVDRALRRQLRAGAVEAARALGCVGLVTVEFVQTGEGLLRFLEVTSGFTYEHLASELATGLDLVALQLASAERKPLAIGARRPVVRGHAMAMRLLPLRVPARLERLAIEAPPSVDALTPTTHVVVDAAVAERALAVPRSVEVLAAVGVVAPDRPAALRLASATLVRAAIHGSPTNRDGLIGAIDRADAELAGTSDPSRGIVLDTIAPGPATAAVLAAAAVALDAVEPSAPAERRRVVELDDHRVAWRVADGDEVAELMVDGEALVATVERVRRDEDRCDVSIAIDGVRGRFPVNVTPHAIYVDGPHGSFAIPRQPQAGTPATTLAPVRAWPPPAGLPADVAPPPRATFPDQRAKNA